ncbi:MAG: tetratricopeptide repeat protein [Planctomycetota bacterium]|jgi:tetratricopeptide (TPR) repeat protein
MSGQSAAKVRSKVFDIEYRVNEAALPLESVRLWYTRDKGATWQLYGQDEDRQPPLAFNAPEEGLYGFYLVVDNATGSSGPEPTDDTEALQWAYVDYTPPIVQLHRPRVDPGAVDNRHLSIRWTALDAHLPPRPIALAFRLAPDGKWQTMADHLANTGRYDWRVPEGTQGRAVVRITVTALGGNPVVAATAVDVAPPPQPGDIPVQRRGEEDEAVALLASNVRQISEEARQRSRKLYQQGLWHRDRGERRLAMARLRDALRLDPTMSVALADLAALLYVENDYDASIEAYRLALRQSPDLRSALEGSARVNIARRRFDEAAVHLQRIVHNDPDDVEAWLNLGDVAIYRGDELTAREHYQKAATLDPAATDVIARAQLRLADLTGLRERYAQPSRTR